MAAYEITTMLGHKSGKRVFEPSGLLRTSPQPQKIEQFVYYLLRSLFLQKVATIEGLSRYWANRFLPPGCEYVPQDDDPIARSFFHLNRVPDSEVIEAVHLILRAPRWPRGAPQQFHSLAVALFFS